MILNAVDDSPRPLGLIAEEKLYDRCRHPPTLMNLGLTDKAVLVTGGGSGIGLACVAALTAEGARVAVIDRRPRAEETARRAGAEAFAKADVANELQVHAAVAQLARGLGELDGIVCSAGVSGPVGADVAEITSEQWDEVLGVNLKGPWLVVKHALPFLAKASHPAVAIVASDASLVATPGMTPYCASKGGVLMLTKALALDLEPFGIRVNCVCPSVVDTPMSRTDLGVPDGFAGLGIPVIEATEVGRHLAYLISPTSASINGAALPVDLGYMARSAYPDEPFRALQDNSPTQKLGA